MIVETHSAEVDDGAGVSGERENEWVHEKYGRGASVLFRCDDGRSNRRLENLGDLKHLSRVGEVIGVVDDLLGTILVDDLTNKRGQPNSADEEAQGRSERTSNGHQRSSDDNLLSVLILQPLTEDVHVKTAIEAKSEALAKERR